MTYVTPKVSFNTSNSAFNTAASWLVRDWTYGAFLQYASGLPIQSPFANNNLNNHPVRQYSGRRGSRSGTFANRVPGVPLYTVDLNCGCYNPSTTFVLNPAAWVDPPRGSSEPRPLTTTITGHSAVRPKT